MDNMKNSIKYNKVLILSKVLVRKGILSGHNHHFIVKEVHENGQYTMHQPETGLELTDYFNPFTDFYFLKEDPYDVFMELQCSMEEKASIYKGTKLDPFYQFVCGRIDFNECIDQVAEELSK